MQIKKIIKIAGAGLAGLTAAINLAREGFKVEVHEKNSGIGEQYKENAQMLPNWFSREDVIEELEKCNVKIKWLNRIEQVEINLINQKVIFHGKEAPVGYTVLRGGENSLEQDFAEQARKAGVEIILNSTTNEADIIATGFSKPITVGYGRVYKGNFDPKRVKVFFNPDYTASVGYGYFFPHDPSKATVKISKRFGTEGNLKEKFADFRSNFLSSEIFEENLVYEFGSLRSFEIPKSAIKDNSLLVGEAAGFQDELFRFGMRYAIISGFLAAKAIIENKDYDRLWQEMFSRELERTKRVRRIFEDFKSRKFKGIPERSEINIEIGKFRRIWLSKWFNSMLFFYPLYKPFVFSEKMMKAAFYILPKLKIVDRRL